MKQLLLLLVYTLSVTSLFAYDFEVDGIYYNVVSLSNLTCGVTSGDSKYTEKVIIPSEVEYGNRTFKVISIQGNAFSHYENLSSVEIPNSVKSINDKAFYNCQSLTSVKIPNSVTYIGAEAFSNCGRLYSVKIPNSITSIGEYAFSESGLTSAEIPNSVTSYGEKVFYQCPNLTSVKLYNSVTSIEGLAFSGCKKLTSIELPNSVTTIERWAFAWCSSLASIELPNSVTTIEEYAFKNCNSLTSIEIPNSVTTIGEYAFDKCARLSQVTLSNQLTVIENGTFQDCPLKFLEIPPSISKIYQQGQYGNVTFSSSIKELIMPYSTKSLTLFILNNLSGWGSWISSIETLTVDRKLPSNMTLPSLKALTVGEHCTSIQVDGLKDHANLESITLLSPTPPPYSSEFSNKQYMNLSVYVPEEYLETYQKDSLWGKFWNLQNIKSSSIKSVISESNSAEEIGRYDLNGRPVAEGYKGLAIIRYSDGYAKKIIMK